MKTTVSTVLIAAALMMTVAVPVSAGEGSLAYLAVFPDEAASTCEFTVPPGVAVAYVVLTKSIPLKQISFRAPIPDCLGGPGNFIFESSPYTVTGDSQSGITIEFPGCITGPTTILTIYYNATPGDPCCSWPALSYAGGWPNTIEFVDCNDVVRPADSAVYGPIYTGECCLIFDVLAPYQPYPADGAAGVSTEVDLAWLLPDLRCGEWIYFGTTPAPFGTVPTDDFNYYTTYDPGVLQPNTTYYWKVYMQCSYDYGATSPLWSFTTGAGPVATEPSTWGRIKALYGE